MMSSQQVDRRGFLVSAGAVAAGSLYHSAQPAAAQNKQDKKLYPVKLAVKYGMIRDGSTVEDKFALIKRIGFEGVEMDSPAKIDRDEVVRARDKTGIVIHGVVDSIHWNQRLSDPDANVREQGLEGLQAAL